MEQIGSLWVYSALLFAILTANYSSAQKQDYKRVCYYTNWSQYRTGLGKFKPQNVDPFVCTHIVYAFAKTSGNRIEAAEWNDESTEWSKGMYAKINDLKKKNPKLKTLLAIGGWTEGNAPISTMASTNESRDEFKLRTEFNREARETGREALLLAIAVPVGEERISSGYKIPEVDRYVDFINLMAYDFHGAWEAQTGHHSPLHRGKAERWYAAQLNVQWAAGYWRRNGASKEKLLIGIAMYGRGFKLQYPSINGIGAQALVGSNGNSMGPFTKSKGLLSFYEICDRLNGNGVEVWDEERRVPYMYDGSDWVGYENVRSVIEKTKWVMDHGYAGIMIWALDQDDFTGHFCKAGKYPLLSAINKTLNEHTPSTEILTGQRDILQATEDYGGITNRIVDSTSLSLTGLTLRHSQTPNAIIHTTTIATTSTTAASIKTTTNVATSTIISSTTSTTEPSTTTTEPSSTTTSEPPTTTTTTEPPTTTVEPSTTTGLPKATSFTELTTAAEDKENSTAPSTGNISTTDTMESESQNDMFCLSLVDLRGVVDHLPTEEQTVQIQQVKEQLSHKDLETLSPSVHGTSSHHDKEMLVCNVNGTQIHSRLETEKFQSGGTTPISRGFEMDYVLVMVKFCAKITSINPD
uniref:Acidic mammalian chitinase n=1 Tax=Magallana gigas TaxID=29159 RepID=K1PKV2_MAGGI